MNSKYKITKLTNDKLENIEDLILDDKLFSLIFIENDSYYESKILSFLNLSNQLNFNLPHELKSNYK